jgi:putative FmdB family regulatory protein
MPLYDYQCQTCGPFREWRSMKECEQSVTCPSCSVPAPRLPTSPRVAVLSAHERIAHERNERSAHQPAVVRREDLAQYGTHRRHQHGVSPLIKQQFGEANRSPPGRPWMVGH